MADSTVAALTALATLNGDELLYCVDDPAGTPLNRKVTASALRNGLQVPNYMDVSGVYIGPPYTTTPLAANALVAGRLYSHLVEIPQDMTVTNIGINVTVAAVGNARLGIYNTRGPGDALPGTLILDAGTVSVNVTNTFQEITGLSQVLRRGWYALAGVTDVTPTVTRIPASGPSTSYAPSGTAVGGIGGAYRAFAYAALPADETAETYSAGAKCNWGTS